MLCVASTSLSASASSVGKRTMMSVQTTPSTQKVQPGDGEDAPDLVRAVHRVRLAYHARERHGQARRGDGEEHAVDIVGHEEVRVALVAEDVPQRYLVDSAEYLHYNNARGQYSRAVQIVLLFGLSQGYTPNQRRFAAPNAYCTLKI